MANRKILPKLTAEHKNALVAKPLSLAPPEEEQLFYIYENNAYQKIGSFVTTDSVLHTYHIFYDFTLRYFETETAASSGEGVKPLMLAKNLAALPGRNRRIFGRRSRATRCFSPCRSPCWARNRHCPREIQAQVDSGSHPHQGARRGEMSAITGAKIDYTQFIPRGHYTRITRLPAIFPRHDVVRAGADEPGR